MAEKKDKIPLKVVKKLPYQVLNRLILKAKKHLKTNQVWIDICKKHKESPDIIDLIPVMFGDLDVSGKTEKGIVILNYQLLADGDFKDDYSYLVHEGTHWLDQCYGSSATKSSDEGDYLSNKFEQKAFSRQIEFIADQKGKSEAEKYTDDLLEHHNKSGKDADKLRDILMDRI
jgi:hypothetical protein